MIAPFPWTYPYQEDGARLEAVVLRPLVPVALVGAETSLVGFALIDSGSEHILASPLLAASAGVDADAGHRALELGIGGETVAVRFVDLTLRLQAPGDDAEQYVEWQAEVGVVSQWRPTWPMILGQVGFLDRFTTTMSRYSQRVAVEDWDAFDQRYGASAVR